MTNEDTERLERLDRFAMAALTGLLAHGVSYGGTDRDWCELTAESAYEYANAMLLESDAWRGDD